MWLGRDLWLGPLPPSVRSRWLRTASTAAQIAEKTGERTETTETTGETTAGTVAAEPTKNNDHRSTAGSAASTPNTDWHHVVADDKSAAA